MEDERRWPKCIKVSQVTRHVHEDAVNKTEHSVMKTLNIGCGTKPIEGAVNVDIYPYSDTVTVVDLNVFPWPWPDNSFSNVNAEMFLEHVPDLVKTMAEIHRVLADGGKLHATVPYWTGSNAWDDPTHVRAFTSRTFDWFAKVPERSRYMAEHKERPLWETRITRIHVSSALPVLDIVPKILGPLYERFFCHILPAQGLRVELIARKQ